MTIVPLQYLRAVAALSVLLYHSGTYLQYYRGDASISAVFGHTFATFGVFAFFALSGLLMAAQANKLADDPARFLTHRIIRIFPALFLACTIRIALAWVLNSGLQFDPLTFILAPIGQTLYVLDIAWTLVYEVAFYLIIFTVIALRLVRHLNALAILWVAALLFTNWRSVHSPQYPDFLNLPLSVICAPFALGLIVPELIRRKLVKQSFLVAGAFVFTLAQLPAAADFGDVLTGLGCTMVVAWFATLSNQREVNSPVLKMMGDWSFAIYLIHVPMLATLYQILPSSVSPMKAWMIASLLAVGMGCIFGMLDVRLYQRLKTYFDAGGGFGRSALCGIFAAAFAASIVLSQTNLLGDTRLPVQLSKLNGAKSADDIDRVMTGAGYHKDDRLIGSLDIIIKESGNTVAGGWVNDPEFLLNRSSIVLAGPAVTPAVIVPRDYRLDVIKAYGFAAFLAPVAFHQTLSIASCPPGLLVYAVAVSNARRAYRTLNSSFCP